MADSDGWIFVENGKMPKEIEGAKAFDWEFKNRRGKIVLCDFPAVNVYANWWKSNNEGYDIVAVRLVKSAENDGWLDVVGDGSVPEGIKDAKGSEWEYRNKKGLIRTCPTSVQKEAEDYASRFNHKVPSDYDFAAVRLVKRAQEEEREYNHVPPKNVRVKTSVPPPYSVDAEILRRARSAVFIEDTETAQQTLTREAYERYKARFPKSQPFRPLSEEESMAIAAAALREHDRVWPRRK